MNLRLLGSQHATTHPVEFFLKFKHLEHRIWFVDTEDQKDQLEGTLLVLGVERRVEVLDLTKGAVAQAEGQGYCFFEPCC